MVGGSRSRRLRAFKRWMKREGIECSDALQLRDDDHQHHHDGVVGMGISVRALGDLKEEDVVARIPKHACLTIRTTAANFAMAPSNFAADDDDLGGLAMALMYEMGLGESSRWAPYLELMRAQQESSMPLPSVWSYQEVDRLLQGTELHGTVMEDKAILWKHWNNTIQPSISSFLLHSPWNRNPTITATMGSFESYLAARTLISSRSFHIDHYHGVGMVPLADLFNHKTGAEDVHLMTSPPTTSTRTRTTDSDTSQEATLTSAISHVNAAIHDHHIAASTPTWSSTHDDDDDDDEHGDNNNNDDDDDLEMTTVKDVQLGAELFNTYGLLGNAALLHRYGFTEPDNPYDIVNVDLGLILHWSSSNFSGQHCRARLSLWRRFHFSGCVSHNFEYFEISFNGRPQFEMLVLLYLILLPHDAYHKINLSLATAPSSDEPEDVVLLDKAKALCHKTGLSREDLLLTKSLCDALSSLADMRESLYGTSSIEDDILALGRCCRIREKKLYHSLMLRIGERRILQKLKTYAAKHASKRKKLKRK